jgi:serine protein kinase
MREAHSLMQYIRDAQDPKRYREFHWTGSFEEYLGLFVKTPKIARNAFQRLYDMILSYGVEEYVENKEKIVHYKFFDDPMDAGRDAIFGLDRSLMHLADVFKSAAHGYGTEKRVLLLHGPVGSAKSTIARLLKKGLERYSRTDEGALYTFSWRDPDSDPEQPTWTISPMHEEPLYLVPTASRRRILEEVNANLPQRDHIVLEGDLCPFSRHTYSMFLEKYDGDWDRVVEHVRVERLLLSEQDRIGVGTFQPKDEKNQDSTELTGDINYRKIAEYGSDSDPRAFNFDGEFNVANRGLVEFIEVLKLDVAFLYDLLGASQEHKIKPKKFAQTHIDEVIVGHTNEPEYRKLQNNEFMEALRDRTVKIDVPYVTKLTDEMSIYEKDYSSKDVKGKHIAPHTLRVASIWSVLTRLEEPKKAKMTLMQKLKLYDGKMLPGHTEDSIKELRSEAPIEGMHGISPRYV